MKRNDNHRKQILKWLMEHGTITQDEAIKHFRCYRLSARIFELREHGHDIKTDMVSGVDAEGFPFRYAKYRMV